MTTETFNTGSGTWTVPTDMECILIEGWGAGGSGGTADNSHSTSGGGAGGGGYFSYTPVTPIAAGTGIAYAVGAGGASKANQTDVDGDSGGSTTVSTYGLTANGGAGGKSISNGRTGGAGGTASGGTTNTTGTGGSSGSGSTGGAGGAGANGGAGGAGGTTSVSGVIGTAPGGGGGGGGRNSYSGGGAAGRVVFTYQAATGDGPADVYEEVGIGVGQEVGSSPSVTVNCAMDLVAGADQAESPINNAAGGLDLSSVTESALYAVAEIPLELLLGNIAGADLTGFKLVEESIGVDALAGLDAVKKVEFAAMLRLAVSHEFQEASQLVAVAALSLDSLAQISGQSTGLLYANLPLPAQHDARFIGGSVYDHSAGIDAISGVESTGATRISVGIEAAVRAMLGFSNPSEIQASLSLAQKSGAATTASKSIETSFILGVGARLLSSPSIGAAVSIATSIASALELVTKVSHLATIANAVGVDLETSNLLGAGSRAVVGSRSGVAAIGSVDYLRAISLVAKSTVLTTSQKAYDCLVGLGVIPSVASSLTARVTGAVLLTATSNVTDEVRIRTLGSIALTVQQFAAVQSVLSASPTVSLRHRPQINSTVSAALDEITSLTSRMKAIVAVGGEIESEALIGVNASYSTVAKNVIGTAIAISAFGSVNQMVEAFKNTSIALGVRSELTATSVGHFRAAIVAAVIARLELLNFNPQVIRIVSEMLSQSTVTDEGLSVSEIVDESIDRND